MGRDVIAPLGQASHRSGANGILFWGTLEGFFEERLGARVGLCRGWEDPAVADRGEGEKVGSIQTAPRGSRAGERLVAELHLACPVVCLTESKEQLAAKGFIPTLSALERVQSASIVVSCGFVRELNNRLVSRPPRVRDSLR